MTRRVLLIACLVCVAVAPAAAYLKLGFLAGGQLVGVRWQERPVPYFVTNRERMEVVLMGDNYGQAGERWRAARTCVSTPSRSTFPARCGGSIISSASSA